MKKILIPILAVIAFSFSSCMNHHTSKREELKKDLQWIAFFTLISNPNSTDAFGCSAIDPNALYFTPPYYPTYITKSGYVKNIIISDSTFDISVRSYSGYIDPSITYHYGVSGNTSIGMCSQFAVSQNILTGMYNGAIQNIFGVDTVIISTAAGNDMLRGDSNSNIISNLKNLVDKVRSRFPNAKIIMVGIHPTLVTAGNLNKGTTNTAIKNYLLNMSNTCFYDPGPDPSVFNKPEGVASDPSQMLPGDSIHYNQTISFAIKSRLQVLCGVTF